MSSAEAEYNSLIEGVQRSFGVQTMLAELGVMAKIIVYTDSSAAKILLPNVDLAAYDIWRFVSFGSRKKFGKGVFA